MSLVIGLGIKICKTYKQSLQQNKAKERAQNILEKCREEKEKTEKLKEGICLERQRFENLTTQIQTEVPKEAIVENKKIIQNSKNNIPHPSPSSKINNYATESLISEKASLDPTSTQHALNEPESFFAKIYHRLFASPNKREAEISSIISEVETIGKQIEEDSTDIEIALTELNKDQEIELKKLRQDIKILKSKM